ncbi:MAG: c-type cytochrome [Burkholderiales bacterium]|nr:c-type cytochrome [Burkholderiales bacterium]
MARAKYAWGIIAATLAGMALVAPAAAQDYKAASWAASCASCHGTRGVGNDTMPRLAGRSKDDLLAMMLEFKADKRKTATIMHQHAKGYTDAQLERIAEYFARQSYR